MLAERALKRKGDRTRQRIEWAFRTVTSRQPSTEELDVLLGDFAAYRNDFENNRPAAKRLLSIGEKPADRTLDPLDHAAMTLVANLLLNLDESISQN